MAVKPQIKASQLAKDLELKSKDITDIMSEKGIEIKSSKSLEPHEFDVIFNAITSKHQIESIDDYIDGVTFIPSKLGKVEAKPEAKPEAKTEKAEKPEVKTEKTQKPKAEKPAKAEVKAETKPEVKVEAKPEVKPEPKVEAKPEVKAEPKVEAKPEVKAEPKVEVKAEVKVEVKAEAPVAPKANTVDRAAAIARALELEKKAQMKATENKKPEGNRPQKPEGNKPFDRKPEGNRPFDRNAKPEGNRPFDKNAKPDSNKPFDRKPEGNKPQFDKPAFDKNAQNDNKFDRFSKAPSFDKPARPEKRDDRKPQQQKPQFNKGGMGMDKEDYIPSAPKEKFQPQPIVRSQTPKGGDGTQKKGATHIVDMRTSSVDLSKYDEKLDNFVTENERDLRVSNNQKLKKQQNQNRQENSKQKNAKKGNAPKVVVPQKPLEVEIPEEITVSEFAALLKVTVAEVIKRLMLLGMMVTANQTIDYDTASLVAEELGAVPSKQVVVTIEEKLFEDDTDAEEDLVGRAPVVCVMGHVDHGKTSLLDAIRHTNVTRGEAGGITQHIGAYRVKINGEDLTFLDTPGHEAFTAMRARGAQATDIAILVVAADDGIMPQTIEAINHAKAAGIDIIVAINKMDKPTANPDAIKQELTKYDLVPEEWGGDVICCPVSALTGMGIEELLENVLLVAEVKELKANPSRRAKGLIIESKLDKGRGPVATVLVQNGTLHNGDIVIAGTAVGRVRAMTDHNGKVVKVAGPSVPVEIIGLSEVPSSGDEFAAVEDERMARELADRRKNEAKEEIFKANARANLNDLFAQISDGVKELNVIVKADVVGSAEAVKQSLEKLTNEEVKVKVIHSAAGGITEGDITFAAASNAIVVGFNVRPDKAALDSAERQNVDVRTYRVIYQCIEEIEAAMKGMLAPKFRENLLGHSEVRQTIHVPGVGTIAGSYILDGKILRSAQIRVVRDGVVIFEDKISSLKRFKDDVKEVNQGYECGIGLDKFNDIRVGDILEAFIIEEIER